MKIKIRKAIFAWFFMLFVFVAFAQKEPPKPAPPGPPGLPVDGGLSFLMATGIAYGVFKLRKKT